MTGVCSPGAPRQDLIAHYEQLRRDALRTADGGGGLGLALFLRRGMAAWIQAWPECASDVGSGPLSRPSVDQAVPADLRSQIATLLAGIVLCLQQEATP